MQKNFKQDKKPNTSYYLRGICLILCGILFLLSFVDYNFSKTNFITTSGKPYVGSDFNIIGVFGIMFSSIFTKIFGFVSLFLPIFLVWLGLISFNANKYKVGYKRCIAVILFFPLCSALFEKLQQFVPVMFFVDWSNNYYENGLGGTVGNWVYCNWFNQYFGNLGSLLILFVCVFLLLIVIFTKQPTLNSAIESKVEHMFTFKNLIKSFLVKLFHVVKFLLIWLFKIIWKILCYLFSLFKKNSPTKTLSGNQSKEKTNKKDKSGQRESSKKIILPKAKEGYVFPTLDLLQKSKKTGNTTENQHEIMNMLVNALKQFGIEVSPGDVFSGPVITRYEITPAPGVRVEKIVNLDKNIALNLRAESVRILAPVPGKGCVGVELPNKNPQMVCLRDILESDQWANMHADIPVVLGRGTTGEPMINDLAKMPHLLIAGSTGSGKTVCINAIIASLVYHSSPNDLRFIMVDPKIVEMQVFNDLPHMLIPVLTDPKKVPNALKWLICEMERRYKIFAKANVRNIASFNAKILKDIAEEEKAHEIDRTMSPEERSAINKISKQEMHSVEMPKEKMPYIVCIIDELADLMMVAPADIETSVARLAQLARAAGIHLILATQRPSVNVITGIIKANLPSRIAFKVASKVDSRTILDVGGADALLGRGDMLFQPPGASGLVRAQGALVSDEEINNIVQFLNRQNGSPQYAMDIHDAIESFEDGEGLTKKEEYEDELIPQAIEILRVCDKPSTSMLQRRLKIGYNRAARMMENLEDMGYVSNGNFRERLD